jgi:hypothetical protein
MAAAAAVLLLVLQVVAIGTKRRTTAVWVGLWAAKEDRRVVIIAEAAITLLSTAA